MRHVGHGASPTNTPDGCWCELALLRYFYASSSPFCTPAILLSSPALGAHVDPEIEDQRRGNQRARLQAAVSAPGVSPQEHEQGKRSRNRKPLRYSPLLSSPLTRDCMQASASKLLKETCSYIRSLHREVDDLSDRLSDLMSTMDSNSPQAEIIRSILRS